MFRFDVEIEGLDELVAAGDLAAKRLRSAAVNEVQEAARAGIREAQTNHPYIDRTEHLTGDATVVPAQSDHEDTTWLGVSAQMAWPTKYASYVDQGTSRSRPYPFVDNAVEKATSVHEQGMESIVEAYADDVNHAR